MRINVKLLFVLLLFLTGCNKFLEEYSPNLVTVRQLSDLDEVLLGSGYVLSRPLNYVTSNNLAIWLNYIDDDVNTIIGKSASINPLGPFASAAQMNYFYGYTTWQMDVTKSYEGKTAYSDDPTWNDLYKRINVLNIILDEIEKLSIKDADKADYHRVKAEALFLRAQFYFFLVNIYAEPYSKTNAESTPGIPLKLTHYIEHQPHSEIQFERTSVQKVYVQIVEDLRFSLENFAHSSKKKTFLRASGGAAKVLLSRVFLFMENYEESKHFAQEALKENSILENVTTSGDDYVFLTNDNVEVLFSQGSLNFQTSFLGAPRDFCVSANLGDTYDANDARYRVFFKKTQYSDSLALNRKYKGGVHQSYISDQFLIRTGEVYLNLAEAAAMLDDAGLANEYLNKLRASRINDYENVQLSGEELINQIRAERRKELCFEGHRWFDLRRYSVNSRYPYSKEITRQFGVYSDNGNFVQLEEFLLKANDPAYTFQIPTGVREFQPAMPANKREVRKPFKITNIIF